MYRYRKFLSSIGAIRYEIDVPFSRLTSFRIGGPADLVVLPETEGELILVLKEISHSGLPWKLFGNGTNILAPDEGFRGVLVILNHALSDTVITDGSSVRCSAGASLHSVSVFAAEHGLSGMEGLEGIPGTVGGACAMNAGAYNTEIKQILKSIRFFKNGEIFETAVKDSDLGSRTSVFVSPSVITLQAVFRLTPTEDDVFARMRDYAARRSEKQPLDYPSAGSVFKRPQGGYAGSLIEHSGMKGYSVGDAQVSPKHAGFIINRGNATCAQVTQLIQEIRERVFEETGIRLERELKYLDEV